MGSHCQNQYSIAWIKIYNRSAFDRQAILRQEKLNGIISQHDRLWPEDRRPGNEANIAQSVQIIYWEVTLLFSVTPYDPQKDVFTPDELFIAEMMSV